MLFRSLPVLLELPDPKPVWDSIGSSWKASSDVEASLSLPGKMIWMTEITAHTTTIQTNVTRIGRFIFLFFKLLPPSSLIYGNMQENHEAGFFHFTSIFLWYDETKNTHMEHHYGNL